VLSALLITSILYYSSNQMIKLYRGAADSIIHTNVQHKYPNKTKTLNLQEEVFQIAFAVVDYSKNKWKRNYHTDQDFLDDKRYVEWKVQEVEGNGTNDWVVWEGGVHKCTPGEWSKFFTPSKSQENKFEMLKRLNTMMCLDERDNND